MAESSEPEALTEYELQRQENIRRNQAMLADLRRTAADVSAAYARSRQPKKVRTRAAPSAPPRRSGRARRQPPPSSAVDSALPSAHLKRRAARFPISEAFVGEAGTAAADPSAPLTSAILAASWPSEQSKVLPDGLDPPYIDLVLKPGNVRKLAPTVIGAARVLPLADRTVVVVGTSFGNLMFWDANRPAPAWQPPCSGAADEVFWFHPHARAVTGITVHPSAPRKIYSCSCNGEICLMDVEKGIFNMIHLSDDSVFSLCQSPDNNTSLYFGEGNGDLKVFDERAGKISGTWQLHRDCISSIDVNPGNAYMLATGSLDSTACVWDLRNMKMSKPESLKVVEHKMRVHSAYFSPSGSILATTSRDNTIGILSVHDFDNSCFRQHICPSTTFKASWGWNDIDLFVGTESDIEVVSIDVNDSSISTSFKARIESAHMTEIPSQFYAHPYQVGCLACVGHRNKIFLWTPKQNTGRKDFPI
ncbi:hypothetical protein EJB05_53086, partial [Eragrostis curvula]